MYWTGMAGFTVRKGGMDGSNPTTIVPAVTTGRAEADAILIDFNARRLYWTHWGHGLIQSSNLDGGDIVTIHERSQKPYGLALVGDRIYWGYWDTSTVLESSSLKPGSEIRVELTGKAVTRLFTVPLWNPPRNRTNNCEGIACSGVCVLTPTSYTCLSF